MNSINQVIIEGNLVRDPTFKETPGGKKVCTVPVAVNRFYKDSTGKQVDEVGFYDVEAWGERFTEDVAKAAVKGRGVKIIGRLKQDRWKDSEGKSVSKVLIVAEHIDFKPFSPKKDGQDNDEQIARDNAEAAAQGVAGEAVSF